MLDGRFSMIDKRYDRETKTEQKAKTKLETEWRAKTKQETNSLSSK